LFRKWEQTCSSPTPRSAVATIDPIPAGQNLDPRQSAAVKIGYPKPTIPDEADARSGEGRAVPVDIGKPSAQAVATSPALQSAP